MEKTRNPFAKTRNLCLTLFGIAISFTAFCECRVVLLQTTPQVVTVAPKRCSFNDIDYRVGENWNPFLLPKGYYRCIRCSCKLTRDGSMAINDCKSCRKMTANGHHPDEGQKRCTHQGKTRKHGTVWAMAVRDSRSLRDDQCAECSCTDGFVTCAIRTCPVLSCQHQQNGTETCCPVCRGALKTPRDPMGCETMGRYYGHSETWSPRIPPRYDLCVSCTCKNTSIECRNPDCPKLTCEKPERKPGACCDFCPADSPTKKPSYSVMDSIRSLIRIRVRKPTRKPELLIFKTRVGRKVSHTPGECHWGKRTFPHNTTFNPTVPPFGVSYCVKCVCNATKIECGRLQCPTNYSCQNPVSVAGKCCKVCRGAGGTTESTVTTGSSARKTCPTGKYWWVFEYVKINGKQQHDKTSIRVQFALEDKEGGIVEIHTIDANTTVKTVKVTNTSKQDFDRVQHNSYQYIYIGKIREVQRVKMKTNEKRACHHTQGCVHTVQKIIERLRARVSRCHPPDTLKMPKKSESS